MNLSLLVIALFVIMIGTFTGTSFAQQFKEPDYDIRGGKVLGFEINSETTSLIISLDARSRGELSITLPRNLIDAKIDSEDTEFKILTSGLNLNFFDEISTLTDRTITIPFSRSDYEITITGTHVFSQMTNTAQLTQSQQIEKIIESELQLEIPDNNAKLLIFSDTQWSGALQSSSFDYTEINGQADTSVIFGCESSLGRQGIFGAEIQKTTQNGYLTVVAIQNQKIISQGSTEAEFGDVLINGNCNSSFETGLGGNGNGGGCLIATAAFGSELAPEVQKLRELRDNSLLQTKSGTDFMNSFNDFYYSFSPGIADYERENPIFKEAVKITITPMISSLSILNYVDMDSESEIMGYGISLILLNMGMYVAVPAMIGFKVHSYCKSKK
ncbi:MAG: hypothetical protein OES27_07990 [Nitrosopumilus sp.]|nr:hypothetical protein [Nitrosopumilus sp.]